MSRRYRCHYSIGAVSVATLPLPRTNHKRVGVANDLGNATIALEFPRGCRVHLVPSHKQALLLITHAEVIPIVHVEVGPSDHPLHLVAWLNDANLEVDLEITCAMSLRRRWKEPEAEVGAIGIELAHGRHEVMHICLHHAEHRVIRHATLTPTLLPAFSLLAE